MIKAAAEFPLSDLLENTGQCRHSFFFFTDSMSTLHALGSADRDQSGQNLQSSLAGLTKKTIFIAPVGTCTR